jgi:hypothetical protein
MFFGCVTCCDCWETSGLSRLLQNAAYAHGTITDRVFEMSRNENNVTVGRVTSLFWCIWHNQNDKIWSDSIRSPGQVGRMTFVVWNKWFTVHQLQCHSADCNTILPILKWVNRLLPPAK